MPIEKADHHFKDEPVVRRRRVQIRRGEICNAHDTKTFIVASVMLLWCVRYPFGLLSIIMHGMLIKDYLEIRIPFREGSLFFAIP